MHYHTWTGSLCTCKKNIYIEFLGSQEFSTSINITSMSWCIKKKKQESNKNLHFLSCITRILWKKKPSMYSKKVNEYISLWIKLILMGQHHFILWGCMWKFIPYHHISFVDEVKRWCTDEPQLSGFLDYADFFSGLNFVINIYWSWPRSVAIFLSLKKKKKKQQWKVK